MVPEQHQKISFVVPSHPGEVPWGCNKEWCKGKPDYSCGCPSCLEKLGLTLVYSPEDWKPAGHMEAIWRRKIVSIRTGRLAKHLIVPGFPGYEQVESVEPSPET